jgi:predicted Zn finger-like uncharacterized protein
MSLATRCSACSTVFRVQQDQLKASEGWVRCGRCGTVFSALEGLFDLEREGTSAPVPLQHESVAPAPPAAPSAATAHVPPSVAATGSYFAMDDAEVEPDDAPATQALLVHDDPSLDPNVDAPVEPTDEHAVDEAAAAASFSASAHDAIDDDAELLTELGGSHTLGESRPVDTGPGSLVPSFVREAERAARWQRPVVRRLTIAVALALPILLAAQVALQHRNMVAARWPGSAEILRAICAPLDCSVQAPRLLNALAVESSGLTGVDGTALYRLQLTLRNQAAWPVAMPALDLTLTDSRGDIVTRRVLRAAELSGSAPEQLQPRSEWSVLATLDVSGRRVTGYTVDLFYP